MVNTHGIGSVAALGLAIGVAAVFGACSASSTGDPKEQQAFVPTVLPSTSQGDGGCNPNPSAPVELCDWVQSVDAVFAGTIVDVQPILDVHVYDSVQPEPTATECSGGLNVGLRISVQVDLLFHGELGVAEAEAEAEHVAVYVGAGQKRDWWPLPSQVDGEIRWLGAQEGDQLPFQKGTVIGMAVTRHPAADLWSLMGTHLFTIDAVESLVFSVGSHDDACPGSGGGEWIPDAKFDLQGFGAALSECHAKGPTEQGIALRTFRREGQHSLPYFSYASVCIHSEDELSE